MSRSTRFRPLRIVARHRPSSARVLRGGRTTDLGRLPRYVMLFGLAAATIWTPISAYVRLTPSSYTSDVSLILPGSGAQSSVNLAELGQASSSAASAFSSSRVSPTETYKRLLAANRTLERAAADLDTPMQYFGEPRIQLVDETSLIHFSMVGASPEEAQLRAKTLLDVFMDEIEILRLDELHSREESAQNALSGYEAAVDDLRNQIAKLQTESGLVSFAHYEDLVKERDTLALKVDDTIARRRGIDAQMISLSEKLGVSPQMAATNLRLHADPEFQELARTLSENRATLALARGRFGPRHPQVTNAVQKLSGAEAQMRSRGAILLGNDAMTASSALDVSPDPARGALLAELVELAGLCESLATTEATLIAQRDAADLRIKTMAPLASRLDDLSRDYQVAETVFSSALARVDTTKSDVYASYPLVQVLADASLPINPTSPQPMIAIAAGITATLMILMGLTLAWLRRPMIDKLLARPAV
ncbi:hypothetical protein K3729_13330 [Rhodobacteraceae bacterium S2214]|nr:hypothetical protein K3729_13330 [Rhodobacteraceae bacterium S2214]